MFKDLVDVDGDGNCFYRALYGYALYNDGFDIMEILNAFDCQSANNMNQSLITKKNDKKLLLQKDKQEDAWIVCVRNYLKKMIESEPEILRNMYDTISNSGDNYKLMIEAYPKWFADIFPDNPPRDLDTFKIVFANRVETSGQFASQLDISIIKHIFEKLEYHLEIQNVPSVKNDKEIMDALRKFTDRPNEKTFYLLNIGEIHYNFVRYYEMQTPVSDNKYVGSMVVGGNRKKYNKIMITGKIYTKYTDKMNKVYVRKNGKKLYLQKNKRLKNLS